jgi:hypothetical protein
MIALTDAVIRYRVGSLPREQRAPVVILNRECVDWLVEGPDDELASLEMPAGPAGPLLKDFTGDVLA